MELVGPICAAFGVPLLALGLVFFFRTRSFMARAVSVDGRVLKHVSTPGADGLDVHQPVVAYRTIEGTSHQFTASGATVARVGDTVPVAYDPANPGRAEIAKPFSLWFVPVSLSLTGAVLLVFGVALTLTL